MLAPGSARRAVREVFLSHVIGGKHLSTSERDFTAMVRGATPDVVLTGVELLARGLDDARPGVGDVVVVDVGGATTDVHSVVEIDPEDGSVDAEGLAREVVAGSPVTRTVEGDLGMRWSARQHRGGRRPRRPGDRRRRTAVPTPASCPTPRPSRTRTRRSPRAAVGLALRRHAGRSRVVVSPEGRVVERTGTDLRRVGLVVGSGGVLRHGRAGRGRAGAGRERRTGPGRRSPRAGSSPSAPGVVVDHDYVLAAAGLLADRAPGRGVPAGHVAGG